MEEPADLARLRDLLSLRDGLDSFGLLLFDRPGVSGYDQTMANCLAFATTGGDGVHYGLLDTGEGIDNTSPVVMTVPMADNANRIVGNNLRHFLALGLASGYFVLEQLQYDYAGTCAALQLGDYRQHLSEAERSALALIAQEFCLEPWHDYQATLDALETHWGARPDGVRQVD